MSVTTWRARFLAQRLDGLVDPPWSGAPRQVEDAEIEQMITHTLKSQPENATHWSTRAMARRVGMSQTLVSQIWRALGLQPHEIEAFKLSTDPAFVDKVRDVVGLYTAHRTAPWCCVSMILRQVEDEEPQIQALIGTAPVMPMRPGLRGPYPRLPTGRYNRPVRGARPTGPARHRPWRAASSLHPDPRLS